MINIRPPAVADLFYPADPIALTEVVNRLVNTVQVSFPFKASAFIVPHAGYIYSGKIAANVYRIIAESEQDFERVVIIGPCHRVCIKGMAIPACDQFSSPLGGIQLDNEMLAELLEFPQVRISEVAHQQEHCLEVQLPFIQCVLKQNKLKSIKLVPILVGDASVEQVYQVIDYLWKETNTLLLISSDLSHFLDYYSANEIDKLTTRTIESLDYQSLKSEMACGCIPIQGLLKCARERSKQVVTLAQCNSADTGGDRNRVVGYGAYAIY